MRSFGICVFAVLLTPAIALADGPTKAPSKAKGGVTKASANPRAAIKTSLGTITIELFQDKAPITVKNFIDYAKAKHYDGTIFHRVIKGFMVQAGGYDAGMKEKSKRGGIKNEAGNGLKNTPGTLAMARTADPDSASAQFFINAADNAYLNHRDDSPDGMGYAVFAQVIEGMDVVRKIEAVPTGFKGSMSDVPQTPVIIESVKLLP